MWHKYKGSRRHKHKEFDRDYDNGGGEDLRHDVAESLMIDKKKLNGHDKAFLRHLGYEILDDKYKTHIRWIGNLNGHRYWPLWGWRAKDASEGRELDFLAVADDMLIYFNNTPKFIYTTLFSSVPQTMFNKLGFIPPSYRLQFKSKQHEKDFLSDMRIIIQKTKVLKYTELANRLIIASNTTYSYSYLIHFLSDKA